MLETTWLFVLVLAHVCAVVGIAGLFRTERAELVILAAMLAFVLFAVGAMGASNVEVVANDGSTVSQAQPAMGWYAMGMALVSAVVAVVAALAWIKMEDTTNGYPVR